MNYNESIQLSEIAKRNNDAAAQIDAQQEAIRSLEIEVEVLVSKLISMKQESIDSSEAIRSLHDDNAKLRDERDALRDELSRERDAVECLQRLAKRMNTIGKTRSDRIRRLQAEVIQQKRVIEELTGHE